MDENAAGATITAVSTENATETTVDNDHFEVADGNLKLKADSSLDFEAIEGGMLVVTITASGDGESATHPVTITVTDVNEAPSIDVRDGEEVPGHDGVVSSLSVDENAMRADIPPLALIEVIDPDAADADILTGQAGIDAITLSDNRFAVVLDSENGLWLHLAEGKYLDFEKDGAEVIVTVTFEDSGGNTASQDVTVMVNDVNEAPVASGMVDTVAAESGKRIDVEIDLASLFTDPDGGGDLARWTLSGNPSWLGLEVEYVTDSDGNEKAVGRLRGEPPITGDESAAANMVTITARDNGGEEGSVSFYVIVDDGNDDVTGVNLLDENGNAVAEVEVNENDASGVVLGQITVDDIDHPMHPHGMHRVTVSDSRFEIREDDEGRKWLALKQGVALDTEQGGEVRVTVTAVDINGERLSSGRFKGTSETFAVIVNNENDGPRTGTIGNWWVTVDDDLDAEDVDSGDWLSFALETDDGDGDPTTGDMFPAFSDQDLNTGDSLTYSIAMNRGNWLEIDEDTGKITNKEGVVPTRGVYRVTVTATDSKGQSAEASFNLNVALSDSDDDYTKANDEPSADRSTRSPSYDENSGNQRVATFTVTDDDQDIPDHPFALKTVEITSIVNSKNDSDLNNAYLIDHDGRTATPMRLWTTDSGARDGTASAPGDSNYGPGYAGAVVLSDPSKNGDVWTYHVNVLDTDPRASVDTTRILNHETVEEITVRVRAVDTVTDAGVADSFEEETDQEILEIDIGIEDVNEAPSIVGASRSNPGGTLLGAGTAGNPGPRRVEQSEQNKIVLYINLEELWGDDQDELDLDEFGASSSVSWIDILYGPGNWDDIIKGRDGETGGDDNDDLTWGDPGDGATGRTIGTAPEDANDDLRVVIVEIDRTERNAQGDRGSFTLTAEDDDGAKGTAVIPVVVTDENLEIGDNAVSLSGSAREGSTLRVNFDDNRDPDLAGSATPALTLYTWYSSSDATIEPGTDTVLAVSTSPDSLTLTQSHVNSYIGVVVTYYETLGGSINSEDVGDVRGAGGIDGQAGGTAVTPRVVFNAPDDGVGHFTITAENNTLTVAARVVDEDYGRTAPTITSYQWQVSDNGRGGWTDVAGDDTDDATLSLLDGDGKYYRVVVSYNEDPRATGDNPDQEEVVSHAIQVADVRDSALTAPPTFTAPTISGSPNPGGTLSVEGRGISSVQWQRGVDADRNGDFTDPGDYWVNIPGATGDLTITAAHAGSTVRAVVSYDTIVPNEDGVTTITTTDEEAIGGTTTTARPTAVDDDEVTASVEGSGHTARAASNGGNGEGAGVTISVSETVDLASLFQDPDTAASRLSFSATNARNDDGVDISGLPTAATGTGRTAVFQNDAGVLVMEPDGTLTYVSDQLRGHDGNNADAGGNILSLDITANDSPSRAEAGNSENTATVTLRINVAPTAIEFDEGDTASGNLTGLVNAYTNDADNAELIAGVTVNERVTATGNEVLAMIDVQDENSGRHSFGSHEVTVTGDERFVITNNGLTSRDIDSDGSTWELQVVRGSRFDYETDDMDPRTLGTQIVLTLVATDGGGLSTPAPNPAAGYFAIELVVTVMDNPIDNPRIPPADNTPGLKDDLADDDGDDKTDGGNPGDRDTDGGDPTPPPGFSLGGIIEDFTDNMDFGEIDLLEDYLLTIDDGLDIV